MGHQTSKSRNQTTQKTTELEACATFHEENSVTRVKAKMEPHSMESKSWVGVGQSPNQEIPNILLVGF